MKKLCEKKHSLAKHASLGQLRVESVLDVFLISDLGAACSPALRPLALDASYSGTITSSNYPNEYGNNDDCQWIITAYNTSDVCIRFN